VASQSDFARIPRVVSRHRIWESGSLSVALRARLRFSATTWLSAPRRWCEPVQYVCVAQRASRKTSLLVSVERRERLQQLHCKSDRLPALINFLDNVGDSSEPERIRATYRSSISPLARFRAAPDAPVADASKKPAAAKSTVKTTKLKADAKPAGKGP